MVQRIGKNPTSVKVKFSIIMSSKKLYDVTKRFDLPKEKVALEWITEVLEAIDKIK